MSTTRSRAGSQGGGSRAGSTHGGSPSRAPGASRPGFPAPLGYDPGRDPAQVAKERLNPNIDFPAEAYSTELRHPFTRRPAFNKTGQDINVYVNQFRVLRSQPLDIYQYDVAVTPDVGSTRVIKDVFYSGAVTQAREKLCKLWIFDDRKLAWCSEKITKPFTMSVDLDQDKGRKQLRRRDKNEFYITIRLARTIRLDCLRAYLQEKMEWDNSVLECMNFLDHVLRQGGSDSQIIIKRLFFNPDQKPSHLDANIDVMKGFYASIRLTQSIQEGGTGLGINVDVSNTAFWRVQPLHNVMLHFIAAWDRKYSNADHLRLAEWLEPIPQKDPKTGEVTHVTMSDCFKILRRLCRLKFNVYHRGKTTDDKVYTIKSFCWSSDPKKYGKGGGNAKQVKFIHKQTGQERSVYDHYYGQYNIALNHWYLPCIESSRGGYFPPEACNLIQFQRYNFKLDPSQTSEMIKFAVTRPQQRQRDIMAGASAIAWNEDPYLRSFGIDVRCEFTRTKAKLIKNPEISYGNGKVNPGVSGRWDLRGKRFVHPNVQPLKSWAFVVTDSCLDKPALDAFIKTFTQVYQGHGGRIEGPPAVWNFPNKHAQNLVVETAYKDTGNRFKMTPQIIFFILRDKTSWVYERLKKSADCRYAIVSQMMQVAHVRKGQPQYCSNVCMKVNCKLGGTTCRIPGVGTSSAFFKRPTMMIGGDVAHPAAGVAQSSMAAMTVSMDKDAAVYSAACETNGYRNEIIQGVQTHSMLRPLIKSWLKRNAPAMPEHVFYFRDGVAEGQFAQVMEHEVSEIRRHIKEIAGGTPKITVVVATKRHHVRFFPEKGDKNGNPLPGTLVEREVTHPFHYDFYLCSHVAIQGTARPVHYHVIHDEIKMPPDELQKMIYQQCYQYQRATTPVSLHPAVYYAHIASNRARSHEDVNATDRMPEEERPKRDPRKIYKDANPFDQDSLKKGQDTKPLIPMGGDDARPEAKEFIRNTMWFI